MVKFKVGDEIYFSDVSCTEYIGLVIGEIKPNGYPTTILRYTERSNIWKSWFNTNTYHIDPSTWKICHLLNEDNRTEFGKFINDIYIKERKKYE